MFTRISPPFIHNPVTPERHSSLVLLPIISTGLFYVLPAHVQALPLIQGIPQLLAYGVFGLWARANGSRLDRLGLCAALLPQGLIVGAIVGIILGCLNVFIILKVVPALGQDIAFLKDTPHARMPFFFMVPWFIVGIALFVEINFRGFQLGRLLTLFRNSSSCQTFAPALAIGISALHFSFDPFMIMTFQHLHWIAVWDGIIWGALWMWTRNLFTTITAHAVEVLLMYLVLRMSLA